MAEYKNAQESKQLIRDALIELIDEKKDVNKIYVKDLIEKAGVAKSTFYSHYKNIYDVIEEIGNDTVQAISTSISNFFKNNDNDLMPYINEMLVLLKENENLYRKIILIDRYVVFATHLKKLIQKELRQQILTIKNMNSKQIDFFIEFITNGVVYMIVEIFKGNSKLSFDDVALNLGKSLNILKKAIENNNLK